MSGTGNLTLPTVTHLAIFAAALTFALFGIGLGMTAGGEPDASSARVPIMSDDEAWNRLPPAETGRGKPLPSWARALAASLPHTTAAMLELDWTFRTSDAIDARLATEIRLAVASKIQSEYGRACALADLRRLGMDAPAIERLSGDRTGLSPSERAALEFADRMTTAGYTSTDAEVANLVAAFGEAKVVAIVLQIAYGNFLFRLAQALALPVEAGGSTPPLEVRFVKRSHDTVIGADVPPAPRPAPDTAPAGSRDPNFKMNDAEWARFRFVDLQQQLEAQRARAPRVSIPTWEEFRQALPEALYPRAKPLRIRWSLLVSGRQPKLGPAWIKTTRTFGSESKQDRVFEETLFWVVTRSLRCFYCMGHCEMLLEAAGLGKDDISQRTAQLASGDWSSFPPAERAAFAFARKLTDAPREVDDGDIRRLVDHFGRERALDVIWWASRCQFMTKISDAFQLQLERENVFQDAPSTTEKTK